MSKKALCLVITLIIALSFSGCSSSSNNTETTSAPASEFPIDKLTEAHLSGNGAVYETCVRELVGEKYVISHAKVFEVKSTTRIGCGYSLYDDDWPLRYGDFKIDIADGQYDIISTLKDDDIIVFEGVLKDIRIVKHPHGYEWVGLTFSDAIIKSVNGTAV